MNVGLFKIPWSGAAQCNENAESSGNTSCAVMEANKPWIPFHMKFFEWSVLSFSKTKTQMPSTVNKALKKYAESHSGSESSSNYSVIRFRPYVSKVPWHTGLRALLSQIFPRYGHYCGPNWSSGKDRGSLVWDKRPIDWLDFCCYCHDMGYDSHSQADLLKADLAFLECLESPRMNTTKGDPEIAHLYKTMCIFGLRNVLIPYRQNLLGLQAGQLPNFRWPSDWKLKGWNLYEHLIRRDLFSISSLGLNNMKWKRHNLQKL